MSPLMAFTIARRWISLAGQTVALLSLNVSPLAEMQGLPAPPAVKPKVHVEEVIRVEAFKPSANPATSVPAKNRQEAAGPFGAGVPRPGAGISNPIPIQKPSPKYTTGAMINRVQGSVDLEAIVRADGTVGDVRVIRSLDRTFGMDQEAIKTAKAWRFEPARDANGVATPVVVIIGFDLRMRDPPDVSADSAPMKVTGPRGDAIVPPRRASGKAPAYPEAARQKRVQGTVVVEAYTNLDGEVVYSHVKKSVPALDQAALDAVRAWRYTRTLLNREYTETLVTAKIQFVLTEIGTDGR